MVSATDGSAFTGAVTVAVTGDGGTQATGSVGSGACTHEGNGFHTYAPATAETNYDHVAFTFIGTGAVPATVQIYTSFPQTGDSFARIGATGSGLTSLATPTNITAGTITTATNLTNAPTAGDFTATMKTSIGTAVAASAVASVTGSVGSVAAGGITASSVATGAVDADALASDAVNEIADAVLDRNMATGTDSGSPTVRTVRQALRASRNRVAIAAGTATVYREDDTTASWTAAVTTTAGNPVSEINPADA